MHPSVVVRESIAKHPAQFPTVLHFRRPQLCVYIDMGGFSWFKVSDAVCNVSSVF